MVDLSPLLSPYVAINILHIIGVVLAVGAVIITDVVNGFLHLRPGFAEWDAKIAPLFSLMVWTGFLLLSVTGTLLFLMHPYLINDTLFHAKMLFVAAVFFNGVLLNVWITPKFEALSDEWEDRTDRVKAFEMIAGVAAVVSVIGWLTIIVLGYLIANT